MKVLGFRYYAEGIIVGRNSTRLRKLQKMDVEINSEQQCREHFPPQHHYDVRHNFCYGLDRFFRFVYGDSGGPVISKRRDDTEILVGVNVGEHRLPWWLRTNHLSFDPTYAVDVQINLRWIRSQMYAAN